MPAIILDSCKRLQSSDPETLCLLRQWRKTWWPSPQPITMHYHVDRVGGVLQMGAEYPVSTKHRYLLTEIAFELSLAGPELIPSRDLISSGTVRLRQGLSNKMTELRVAPRDVLSSCWSVNIGVKDVDTTVLQYSNYSTSSDLVLNSVPFKLKTKHQCIHPCCVVREDNGFCIYTQDAGFLNELWFAWLRQLITARLYISNPSKIPSRASYEYSKYWISLTPGAQ
jgi:hypothetical protein